MNIGHNSIQPSTDNQMTLDAIKRREESWRRFELAQVRGERARLTANGTIKTIGDMEPQMLVQTTDGKWIPQLKIVG